MKPLPLLPLAPIFLGVSVDVGLGAVVMVESRGGGGGGRVGTRRDVDGARQPSRPAELTLRDRREVKFLSD